MNKKLLLGFGVLCSFVPVSLGLVLTGCMGNIGTSGNSGSGASLFGQSSTTAVQAAQGSLTSCLALAQQIEALTQSDPCQAASMTVQALHTGCYTYINWIPGAAGQQVPSEADALAQLNQFLASPMCSGM